MLSNPTSQSSSGTWKSNDSKDYKVSNGSPNVIDKNNLANPITQSRINLKIGDSESGWVHIQNCHFSGKENASQSTISESEAKNILSNPTVIKVPISKERESFNKLTGKKDILYERVVVLDKNIGIDKFSN